MKDYFLLQYSMTNRKLMEFGINPILGYILGLIALILFSGLCYYKTQFANYIILLIGLSFVFKLSEENRSDFLLATFGSVKKRKIRILENLMVGFPFLMILLFNSNYLESVVLALVCFPLAIFDSKTKLNFTIPTPFSNHLFEFTTGFRNTFYLLPIAYALTIIAVMVDNFNLGIFSIMLVFLISLSYYSKPEAIYFVWMQADTPKSFLLKKIAVATRNIALLTVPIILGLSLFYPSKFGFIILFYFIGLFFLYTIILAKYSAYPHEINLLEGLLFTISIFFPPLLLAIIPFFYFKSINKLNLILNDKD